MNHIEIEQGTPEWKDIRAGKVTASHIADVFAKPRKGAGESTTRANYRARLVCEILSGKAMEDEYESWAMKRGTKLEPDARAEYDLRYRVAIETLGFVQHPTIDRAGCSPDGAIGQDGLIQVKCPITATHLDWIRAGRVPAEHIKQMQFELACTGRQWSDFVSYDPNLPDRFKLFVVRLKRDETVIKQAELEVLKFLAEVDEILADLDKPKPSEDLTGEWTEALHDINAQKEQRNAQEIG